MAVSCQLYVAARLLLQLIVFVYLTLVLEMLLKQPIGRSRAYDLLHRGGVLICVAVTAVGLCGLSMKSFNILMRRNEKAKALQEGQLQDAAQALTSSKEVQNL